jgi:hypothetical protein
MFSRCAITEDMSPVATASSSAEEMCMCESGPQSTMASKGGGDCGTKCSAREMAESASTSLRMSRFKLRFMLQGRGGE